MRLSAGLFLAVVIVSVSLAGCSGGQNDSSQNVKRSSPSVEVQIASAQRGDVSQTLELVGNFLPRRRTIIVTDVDGVVKSIPRSKEKIEIEINGQHYSERLGLDMGQKVKKGDVLVQIDQRNYQLALDSAQASFEKAKKDLAALKAWRRPEEIIRLRASRDEAVSQVTLVKSELNRAETLFGNNTISQSTFDQQTARYLSAKATSDRAEADLAIALNGPTQPEIDVAVAMVAQANAEVKIRQDELDRTTIRAPYDSVITERFVDEGERVTAMPRIEILELMDLSLVIVQVGIPERYIHNVKIRDFVTVKAKGIAESVPGIVILVNDKIDTNTRTYRVRVAVDNRAERFKAGQFVRTEFVFKSVTDSLTVPAQAVAYSGGQPQVFVYAEGKVLLRNVSLGLSDNKQIEIVDGLDENEQVVVDDPAILSDGMSVRIKASDATVQTSEVSK